MDQSSENFRELKKSVELVGIKDPVLARLKPEGGLEILSGQRRHLAALALNYPVPTIIQKIDDADAKIIVADGRRTAHVRYRSPYRSFPWQHHSCHTGGNFPRTHRRHTDSAPPRLRTDRS